MRWVPDRATEPPEPPVPTCPVCGQECSLFYKDMWGDVFACDECVKTEDADEEQMD